MYNTMAMQNPQAATDDNTDNDPVRCCALLHWLLLSFDLEVSTRTSDC